jgi:hypothetical protein
MLRRLLCVCMIALFVAPTLKSQTETVRTRVFFAGVGLGATSFTELGDARTSGNAAAGNSRRGGVTIIGSVGAYLSPRVAVRNDLVLAPVRGRDLWGFLKALSPNDDDPPTARTTSEDNSSSSMIAYSPAVEFRPSLRRAFTLRLGPALLRSERLVDDPLGGSAVPRRRIAASGWGWRAGVSASLGGTDSRVAIAADMMRAPSAGGTLTIFPVAISLRLF